MKAKSLSAIVMPLVLAQACAATVRQTRKAPPPQMIPAGTPRQPPPAPGDVDNTPNTDPDIRRLAFITPTARPVEIVYRHRARSMGSPTNGTLENGRCLPSEGPGFVDFSKNRCATDETIVLLMFAIKEVMTAYPDTPPIVLGSLSRPGGGPLKPHRSHCSGRDVDIGFIPANGRPLRHFVNLGPEGIDYDRTFFMIANLIATGRVKYIFINYSLQSRFYEAAKRMGYDEDQLSYIIQYPRPRKLRTGIIRHARGHKRHFHVRFACPDRDTQCTDE